MNKKLMQDILSHAHVMSIDAYQPPFYPNENFDVDAILQVAKNLHADVLRISVMGKLANYDTDEWETPKALKGRDFLKELLDKAHANHMLVVPYVPGAHTLPFDLVQKYHPDWVQKRHPLDPQQYTINKHSGTENVRMCPLYSYRKFYRTMLDKTVLKYDFDGWYTDGWKDCYFLEVCYCDRCRKAYLEETGEDIWTAPFYKEGEKFEQLSNWYQNRIVKMVAEEMAYVKSKKDLVTSINGIAGVLGHESQGKWGPHIDPMYDILHFERKANPYDRAIAAAYSSVIGRSTWFYAGLYSPLQFQGSDRAAENYADEMIYPYRKELYGEYMIPIAMGHSVNHIRSNSLVYDTESEGYPILKEIGAFLHQYHDTMFSSRYIPYAGCVSAAKSRYDLHEPVAEGLIRQGIQATIVKDTDIPNAGILRAFEVIVNLDLKMKPQILDTYVLGGGNYITDDEEALDLFRRNFPVLRENSQCAVFLYGRGKAAFLKQRESLTELMAWMTDGLLIRSSCSNGEAITILSRSHENLLCTCVNATNHLSDTFDEGLTDIPNIEMLKLSIRVLKPVEQVYSLRDQKNLSFTQDEDVLTLEVKDLREFDVLAIRCKKAANEF